MKKSLNFSPQKGFTLVEIVLVIAIIGITATLLISLVNPARQFQKANDAKRKADLHQLQAAFELYRADQGTYPANLPSCGSSALTGGTDNTVIYLQKIPCDPRNSDQFQYSYEYDSSNDTYKLIACLENLTDPQIDKENAPKPAALGGETYCDGDAAWSYTVISP